MDSNKQYRQQICKNTSMFQRNITEMKTISNFEGGAYNNDSEIKMYKFLNYGEMCFQIC